jgi:hypothetical protein
MNCACCGHPEKDHCKGSALHTTYKDQARMVKNPSTYLCPTRHCTLPMCCCLSFAATADEVRWPNTPMEIQA